MSVWTPSSFSAVRRQQQQPGQLFPKIMQIVWKFQPGRLLGLAPGWYTRIPGRESLATFLLCWRETSRRGRAGGGATNVSKKTPHQSELTFIDGNCCNCCLQPQCCRSAECSTQRVRNSALSYELQNTESNHPISAGLELRQRAETAPDESYGQYVSAWHIFRIYICCPVYVFRQSAIWATRVINSG